MTRRKGGSLEYDVAPDLVQPGAKEHRTDPEPPRRSRAASSRLDYAPEPFPGARAPAGPSPDALATLRERGMLAPPEDERVSPRRTPPGEAPRSVPRTAASPTSPTPSRPAGARELAAGPAAASPSRVPSSAPARTTGSPSTAAASGTRRQEPVDADPDAPRRRGRPRIAQAAEGGDARIARTVRLAPNVDAKLQAISEGFGVDLTAAVAIAVTHGYLALTTAGLVRPVETPG